MEDIKEIYQALLDGKTLVNKKNTHLTLENSSVLCVGDPKQWNIYNEWEMKPAEWSIRNTGLLIRDTTEEVTLTQKFGMKYHTRETANKAIKEMRKTNLLRYWASVIDPDWKPDWRNESQKKWYIEHKISTNTYYGNYNYTIPMLGTVYMSKKAVIKICEALNKGELKL